MEQIHNPTMRVISILETIAANPAGYKLSEIATLLEIPIGTISPIIKTLKNEKFLSFNEKEQTYILGIKIFEIGSRYTQNSNSYEGIVEIMTEILKKCGETVHFGILDGTDVLYLAKVDSAEPIRMYSAVGKRLPAYGTGIGKALLSEFSVEELKQLYPKGLKALTAYTVTDFDELCRQLKCVKQTSFSYECEESNELIRCVGMPLYKNGHVAAAVSVSVPTFRYSKEKQELIERTLKEYCSYMTQSVALMNL